MEPTIKPLVHLLCKGVFVVTVLFAVLIAVLSGDFPTAIAHLFGIPLDFVKEMVANDSQTLPTPTNLRVRVLD